MTDRYAVFGNPVGHSRSPEIHALFATQTGQSLTYERVLAPLDGFATSLQRFIDEGGRGANVTLPFKEEAFVLADDCSRRAELAGAANTLKFDFGPDVAGGTRRTVYADNTDGVGLIRDVRDNLSYSLEGTRVLVLGAGGAVRGILGDLAAAGPAYIAIANRTAAKAEVLVSLLQGVGPLGVVEALEVSALPQYQFDLVINATSASLHAGLPSLPTTCFAPGAVAYDLMYAKELTPFLAHARLAGAQVSDGLGMLVEQAAEAFYRWRGVKPETRPVIDALRQWP